MRMKKKYSCIVCSLYFLLSGLQAQEKEQHFFLKLFSFFKKREKAALFEEKTARELQWAAACRPSKTLVQHPFILFMQRSVKQRSSEELSPGGTGGGIDLHEETELLPSEELPEEADFARSYKMLSADTSWLQQYYAVYHDKRVNPYGLKWKTFDDTLHILLYDSLKALGWHVPLSSMVVTSDFGMRRYRWHYGVDLRLKRGASVRSAFYGVVRLSQYQRRGFGHYVVVHHHNGLETVYAHLSKRLVKRGDIVQAGDVVGLGGSTGRSNAPHLHFEARYQGLPINPNELFDFEKGELHAQEHTLAATNFAYMKQATSVRVHRVRPGQTLSHISRYYGVSVARLCRLNGISRRSILRIGQKIRIR